MFYSEDFVAMRTSPRQQDLLKIVVNLKVTFFYLQKGEIVTDLNEMWAPPYWIDIVINNGFLIDRAAGAASRGYGMRRRRSTICHNVT